MTWVERARGTVELIPVLQINGVGVLNQAVILTGDFHEQVSVRLDAAERLQLGASHRRFGRVVEFLVDMDFDRCMC